VKDKGVKILFGLNYEEKQKFHYGAVTDIEGNQIWIVEEEITFVHNINTE